MTQTDTRLTARVLVPPTQPEPKSLKAMVLAAMCLALFMTNFDGTSGDVALPQIQRHFGSNMLGVQWFLNAYHLPVASLLLATGKFGDFYGRKKIFLWGVGLFTAASMLCGLAPSLPLLIASRIIQGIGGAALIPLSLTIVTATFTEEKSRTKAIGIWSAVSALALVAGAGLGGILVDFFSWRSIFFINVPLGVVTFALTAHGFRETRPLANKSLNAPNILLSIASIAFLTYLLTQGGANLASAQTLVMLVITLLSFGLFALAEQRSDEPIIPATLVRNRTFLVICLTQLLVFFMSGGLFFILSLFLQHIQGYSAALTGLCFLPMNGAIIAASFASGWVVARTGWRFSILTGLTMLSVAILTLTRISTDTAYTDILWTLVLAGLGGGLVIPPLAAGAMNSVYAAHEGIASAVSSISIQLGGILGIGLQGGIFSHWLMTDLDRTLTELALPAQVQRELVAGAMQHFTEAAIALPHALSPQVFEAAIRQGFISGLHATLFVALGALLMGLGAIACFVPPKITPPDRAS
ncbi:MAG: MFS transporter [Cyanobacteria bacterium J06634_6]